MEKKTKQSFFWLTPLVIILFTLLISGCPKKQTVSPFEEKKESSETISTSQTTAQKPAPSEPTEQPSPPIRSTPLPSPTLSPPSQPIREAGPSAPEAIPDPITNGLILLNPAILQHAKIIQSRLAELGLYKAAVDGVWGKMSRASLKIFKQQNSLGSSDQWDKETQVLLFRGTSPIAGQGPTANGSILLNPAVPQDAETIQTRLAELGLYKGAIDGIWGKGSQAALKSFREKNSLGSVDQWDKETQVLLFIGTSK